MELLTNGNQEVRIDAGELVSYQVGGHEYIHQKGSPGWRSSDTEMFPIIGPTAVANFRVQVPKGNAIQDQHGLLREMDYDLVSKTAISATFQKIYIAGALVKNSKFPDKSTMQWLIWPFNFKFTKSFHLQKDYLEIRFTVSGEKDMPFMLGYHPAFKLYTETATISTPKESIALKEILAVGSRALEVVDCNTMTLKDQKELTIKTTGFGHFMLWTEVPNMVCIEPITFYPYSVDQNKLHEGFSYLEDGDREFKLQLIP